MSFSFLLAITFIWIAYPYAKILLDIHTLTTKNLAYSLEYYEKDVDSDFELITAFTGYKSKNKIIATTKNSHIDAFFYDLEEQKAMINIGYLASLLFDNSSTSNWLSQNIRNYLQDMYISSEQLQMLFENQADVIIKNSSLSDSLTKLNLNKGIQLQKIKAPNELEIKSNYVFQIKTNDCFMETYICKENEQLLLFYKDGICVTKIVLIFETINAIDIQIPKETISDKLFEILRIGIDTIT